MPDALMNDGAVWFTVPAVIGTIFFLLRLGFMLIGGEGAISEVELDSSGDPTESFKLLSIQGVAAFLMGAGWGGIAALRAFGWEWMPSMFFGVATGFGMMWLLILLLKAVHDLQSSGNITAENAVGTEGTVYANIPEQRAGRGQVQVVINGRQRIYTAISDAESIPSQARVRVTRVNEDRSLTVTRV